MADRSRISQAMPVVPALQVLADLCAGDQIVVTNQGSARLWPQLRRRPLDFHYNPSTMGGRSRWRWVWPWPNRSAKCWWSRATARC